MCLYLRRNMCPMQIFFLFTLICTFPLNLWAIYSRRNTKKQNTVNEFRTISAVSAFWGNVIRLLLSEQIEHGLLSFIRKIFPQIFGDLNPSDIAIDKVTRPPDQPNLLIKELIDAFIFSQSKFYTLIHQT
uniref:Uncharacterized protein n=1 Tax=Wuchereria bancrofti TaxID=6293 RepID=A0A1I8ESI4_WUCBA